LAQERNVEVIVAQQRVQQAVARIAQARSSLLPQLEGSSSQYRKVVNLRAFGIDIPNSNPLVGPFNSFDARVGLIQTIFDLPTLKRLKSAKVEKSLSLADEIKVKQDVMALVATLYLNAQRADQGVALARALIQQGEKRDRLSRSRMQVGLGTPLEVTQKNAELEDNRNRLSQALTLAEERRLDLVAALGLPMDQKIKFSSNDLPISLLKEKPITEFVVSHPDVLLAQKEVQQVVAERKVTKGEYYPKILGRADYGLSGIIPTDSDDTYNFGAELAIPIYQGGLRGAQLAEATSRIREGEARLTDTQQNTEAKILSAQEGLKRALTNLQAAKADKKSAKTNLSVARSRYQTGLGTELAVVEASTRLALAQDGMEEAEAGFRLAKVNWVHATGKMGEL
jgi:outer membrane protein TolC